MWLSGIGLVIALLAYASVRRLSRKVDALSQSYWELRYEYTRLRAQVASLDPAGGEADAPPPEPPPQASVTFVPLSAMRKKDN